MPGRGFGAKIKDRSTERGLIMSLKQLKATGFEEVVYHNGESCLVIFSRKDCHVCKEVVPVLEQLQPQYEKKFGFYYVDVEEDKALFQRFL